MIKWILLLGVGAFGAWKWLQSDESVDVAKMSEAEQQALASECEAEFEKASKADQDYVSAALKTGDPNAINFAIQKLKEQGKEKLANCVELIVIMSNDLQKKGFAP